MKKVLLLICISFLLNSCSKKIEEIDPFFTFSKDVNGVIQFEHDIKKATSFEWDFGDGTTSTEEKPSHQYAKNGTYRVVLIAKNKKSQVTKIYEVVVSDAPKPVTKFSYKSLGEGTIQFTNESKNSEGYLWDFGDNSTTWEIDPKHSYAVNGTYEVKLTAKNANGSTEYKQNITIADAIKPIADFSINYGSNGFVSFNNLSKNATSFNWSFGNGQTSTAQNPSVNYSANGNYSVVLTAKSSNGESTVTKTVSVSSIFVPTSGEVVFWTAFNSPNIKIYVNGTYRGLLTKYRTVNSAPACGTEGFVTVSFPQGAYSFTAEEDSFFGSKWSGTINVTNGQCRSLQLTK